MNYIILDLEATCENNDRDFPNEIIEIGAVKINDKKEIVGEFNEFIKPVTKPILTNFCKELTTISQEDVDNANLFPEVLKRFREWIGNEPYVLCSWGIYDKNQFTKDCILHNIGYSWVNPHISIKHQHASKILKCDRGVGMAKALRIANIPLDGTHHRGIDDAKNIAKIFLKYFDVWEMPV